MYTEGTIQETPVEQKSESRQGFSIDPDVIFSNHKGVYKKGTEKRQTGLLAKISFITPFLAEDEEITLVTTGCSPMTILEQFFGGWVIFYVKRAYLIFTDRRIFHIPTTSSYAYRDSVAHIPYTDCKSIAMKGHSLVVTYRNGKKEKFFYINSKERKKIKSMFKNVPLPETEGIAPGRTHLCPRCIDELEKENYECPTCHLVFKNKKKSQRVSLIYPGGGYFYTGHPILGALDAIAETYLTLGVLMSFMMLFKGEKEATAGIVLFSLLLCVEKAVTIYETNNFIDEYIPLKKQPEPRYEEQVAALT